MVNYLWENLFRHDKKTQSIRQSLKENILFKNLNPRELHFIQTIVHERHYRAGETVFRQGELGVGMYIIVHGRIDISMLDTHSNSEGNSVREIFVTRLETGDFFGELSLVEEEGRRNATAVASEDCILIGFFKPDLMSILDRNPTTGVKVVFRLAEVLGRRLKDTTDRISQLKAELKLMSQDIDKGKKEEAAR